MDRGNKLLRYERVPAKCLKTPSIVPNYFYGFKIVDISGPRTLAMKIKSY